MSNPWLRNGTMLLLAAGVLGCGDGGSRWPTDPRYGMPMTDLWSPLGQSLQHEYRTETIYQGVIDDLGPLAPFVNVLSAEQRHSLTIRQLFETRGMTPPPNSWTPAMVPHFTTVPLACRAAAAAERASIAMYGNMLLLDLPADVRQAFERVRLASLTNHLPAFERCS